MLKQPTWMPFLFFLPADGETGGNDAKKVERDEYHVTVALFDYHHYNSSWMDDAALGPSCLVPDVDLSKEEHVFYSEKEALEWIANWWKGNIAEPEGNPGEYDDYEPEGFLTGI